MADKKNYPDVNPNPDFPKIEEEVLRHWQSGNLFKNSIENRADASEFVFYDGPPFANGLPHYGHLLTGYVKDLYARYQTMRGKKVERRFGWDCHGLPAEMGSEKELGISGRGAIQNFGIDKFNEHCRTSVMKYTREWEDYVTRQARWVDFKNDYKSMDINFMESVLWAFKQLYDKGWVYESFRVMPYSWAAETPLSNFETKLDNSYREREDKAIYVRFKLKRTLSTDQSIPTYVIAWTTTPWTLPSNLALAINPAATHHLRLGKDGNAYFYASFAENKINSFIEFDEEVRTLSLMGKEILNWEYEPLFPYFKNAKNAFRILDGSSFVTDGDGTGVVHIAPGFGEDDQKVSEANGIDLVVPVDGQGKYTDEIVDLPNLSLKGLNVIAQVEGQTADEPYKPEQVKKYGLVNLRIINWLKNEGKLIKQEEIKHNYPHCWRTDQPLIYRAMPSWYVEVTKFRDRAVEINKQINWIPEHIRDGQMGHMLATAPDWSISRNRFWGTPIPVWRSKSGKVIVCGSIAEIEKLSGKKVADLHRPYIDDITFEKDGETYTRVEDVFDCWFESGSMPFAQVHYPFENKEWFETHFPADFITEYVGQTRGWFNTLIMLSTALFDKPPFLNCICHGVVLDSETGLKYSKRLKNYKDPMEVMDKFGADALRWLMISSPVMRGMDLAVDPEGKFIRDVVRLAIKPIWNAYNFFTLYANADGVEAKLIAHFVDPMDRYIAAKCVDALIVIEKALDAYDTPAACDAVMQFFEALNNWYIRRNKERFWSTEYTQDKQAAYDTLYTVLTSMCRAAAPLLPLTLDDIYKGLTKRASVHLEDFPSTFGTTNDEGDELFTKKMDIVRDVCNAGLAVRNKLNIRVRQPLKMLTIVGNNVDMISDNIYYKKTIEDELNIKEVVFIKTISDYATLKLSLNNPVLGKRLPEKMKQIIPASKKGDWKQVDGAVEICGEKLLPGEYTLQLEPKPEYANRAQALSTNDALVILDTNVTPELEAEGIARDLVRMIQQARKDANFNVSDRIALALNASDKILTAAKAHADYISEQTLAKSFDTTLPAKADFTADNTLEDQPVQIAISKCA
ncbi:MAG: isoleucine--tRNA ligase [Rickettsiales bacterium]|nr:isoleucine--tRNA ligase [Rickettsiales bacterium]